MSLALVLMGGLLFYDCGWPRKGFEGGGGGSCTGFCTAQGAAWHIYNPCRLSFPAQLSSPSELVPSRVRGGEKVHRAKGFTWCLPELQFPSGEAPESIFFPQKQEEGHPGSDVTCTAHLA